MSRSSLSVIQIKIVWILTLLQAINFVFFMFNTIFLFWENLYAQFVIMTWVGLMGGASYVNVMYNILESKVLVKTEKELSLTITTVFNDMGVLFSSLVSLLLTNTVFKT